MKTGSTKPTVMSVDEIRAATTAVGALLQTMKSVVPLTADERRTHKADKKIGPKTLRMLQNRVAAAQQYRELLPPAFDMRKFEREAALTAALGECLAAIETMGQAVRDTLLTVGKGAVSAGATAYAHIKVTATSSTGLKGTVDRLGRRSPRQAEKPAPVQPAKAPPAEQPPQPAAPSETPVNKAA